MIVTELFEINGRSFTRTYSDANRYVVRDGVSYSEANDPTEFNRVYTQGDLIPDQEIETQAQQIINILMGEQE